MVVHGSRALAEDPLFERLLDVDPELLLPYVTQRLGGMQKMAVEAGRGRSPTPTARCAPTRRPRSCPPRSS